MPTKNSKPATTKPKKPSPVKPKFLDTLRVPGMSPAFAGYDGGIPLWLLARGLTVSVDKNWPAKPGDKIEVLSIVGMKVLAEKTLEPGEEARSSFSFAISDSDLPNGDLILGYRVWYTGGPSNDLSYPLTPPGRGGSGPHHSRPFRTQFQNIRYGDQGNSGRARRDPDLRALSEYACTGSH